MTLEPGFWQQKTLASMNTEEWEALCDGCGKCCLHKLEDEDNGEVYYTEVACRLLDARTARCTDYSRRQQRVPDCLILTPEQVPQCHWLPSTCAYRRLSEGQPLPDWHPLLTGDSHSVHAAGHSVIGRVISEQTVSEEDLEDHIVHWVE